MRNSHRLFAQILPGLLFGFVVAACGSTSPPDGRRLVDEGRAGDGSTIGPGGGTPVTGQGGGTGDLGVDDKPPDMPPPPGCGDGNLTSDEACDDGNNMSGDGCNAACLLVEKGFSCPNPGKPCRAIARCGDGIVASSEQCDDGNTTAGDGCSDRCRVELGKKCEGMPSVCSNAKCGDGKVEGAEACDDGNTAPFDGCSALCLREPDCSSGSCKSSCGDGLLIDEECDDGNQIDGDGCSSECKTEKGFTCKQVPQCEKINDKCVLRVPAIFRDFSDNDTDFGWPTYPDTTCGIPEGDPIVKGIAKDTLDKDGRPQLGVAPKNACIQDATSFSKWFRDNPGDVKVIGDLVLFDNTMGGFVNRFGKNGEKLVTYQAPAMGMGTEQQVPMATSQATCMTGCAQRVRSSLQCDNTCRPDHDKVRSAGDTLMQLTNQLTQLQNAATPDDTAIAAAQAKIDAQQMTIDTLTAAATKCDTDCQTNFDGQVAKCVADCKPCSYNAAQFCTGGKEVDYDGTPLFFPVDSVTGPTADLDFAQLPLQYGYTGWPSEDKVFPGAKKHNFSFTSEVQYWFRYDKNTNATLAFSGDDDVWVFVNGILAVDLGGIHVPMDGSVTINNTQAVKDKYKLVEGNVYKIVVFQAERKRFGSSFRLTLSGFEATPSDCSAVCGDGILSFGEECDDGVNDGGYGECDKGCKLGPFCGDGMVQEPEQCDNGPGGGQGCPGCRRLEVPK